MHDKEKEISIEWTPFALTCLDDIYDYVFFREKSADPAIKLVNAIFEKVGQLKSFPESGSIEPLLKDSGNESRYLVEFSYKIIYEYHPVRKAIIITDIFHTRQYPQKMRRSYDIS